MDEEEEQKEIIRAILHQDTQNLKELLAQTVQDLTQIRDEMGYTLLHLSAYNNTDRCLELLLQHLLQGNTVQVNLQNDNSDYDILQKVNRR